MPLGPSMYCWVLSQSSYFQLQTWPCCSREITGKNCRRCKSASGPRENWSRLSKSFSLEPTISCSWVLGIQFTNCSLKPKFVASRWINAIHLSETEGACSSCWIVSDWFLEQIYMASCCFQGPSCLLSLQWTLIVVIWRWVVARGNLSVPQHSNGGCGAGGHAPLPGASVGKQAEDLAGITLWMPVDGARVNSIWSKILSSLQGLLRDSEMERRLAGILEHPEFRYSICSFKGWGFFP